MITTSSILIEFKTKNMKRIIIIITICLIYSNSFGQWFQPSISFLSDYSVKDNNLRLVTGKFSAQTRKINFGFEIKNNIFTKGNYSLAIGIRYLPYTATILGLNQIQVVYDNPAPFQWKRKFGTLSLPISILRNFKLDNKRSGNIYLNASMGIFFANTQIDKIRSGVIKNINNLDTIQLETLNTGEFQKTQLVYNIGLGGCIEPFKNFNQISLGLYANYQLNNVTIGDFYAKATNSSQNLVYPYEANVTQSFLNLGVTLTYQFKRNRKI